MARYSTTIRTDRSAAEAFAFMADLRNFEGWDPGVQSATQVVGDGGGPDAEFDVVVDAPGSGLTLRYVTTEYDAPRRVVVRAESKLFTSLDRIDVVDDGTGSRVTYDAELRLNGPLGVFDIALKPIFNRIGRRADSGLQRALDGTKV
ncbi:MAG: SRPBCC family protein [Ilumatobacteraceae bacterium]